MDEGSPQRVFLRHYLAENDTPCPSCGYNLRGLTTTTCPECNQALVLRVGLEEPRLGLWIAGLVGLAAGAGFNGLLLVYILIMFIRDGWGIASWFTPFILHNLIAGLITGGFASLWIRQRRRVRRWSPRVRWGVVVACWLIAILNVAVFARLIR